MAINRLKMLKRTTDKKGFLLIFETDKFKIKNDYRKYLIFTRRVESLYKKAAIRTFQSSFYRMKQNLYKNYRGMGEYSDVTKKINDFKNIKETQKFLKMGRFLSKKKSHGFNLIVQWLLFPRFPLESIMRGQSYETTYREYSYLKNAFKTPIRRRSYEDIYERFFMAINQSMDSERALTQALGLITRARYDTKRRGLIYQYFEQNKNPRINRIKEGFIYGKLF